MQGRPSAFLVGSAGIGSEQALFFGVLNCRQATSRTTFLLCPDQFLFVERVMR